MCRYVQQRYESSRSKRHPRASCKYMMVWPLSVDDWSHLRQEYLYHHIRLILLGIILQTREPRWSNLCKLPLPDSFVRYTALRISHRVQTPTSQSAHTMAERACTKKAGATGRNRAHFPARPVGVFFARGGRAPHS